MTNRKFYPAGFLLLFLFILILPTYAKEEERWINFYDSAKGLWAKQNTLTLEVLYLYRYGPSREQVSYLTESEIKSVKAKALLSEILGKESEGRKRGFGDSVFRAAATVQEVMGLIEEAGWRKTDYQDGKIVYRKERMDKPLLVSADRGKKLTAGEFRVILSEAGVPSPVSHPVSADHRNQ